MPRITHIDPNDLLLDSFRLGKLVYESGFRPKHAISIWRGGTPVGLGVDAFFKNRGISINHTTIATGSYTGIGEQGEVAVKNLEHLVQVICPEDGLLIVDDVYESGNTIAKVVELLRAMARANAPTDIRVATVHRKPGCSKYTELPVYALSDVDEEIWIDYPHEIADLVSDDDPDDKLIRSKDETIWKMLRSGEAPTAKLEDHPDGFHYISARQLLIDSIGLGIRVANDVEWQPNFMVALWPGGVVAGLPVHETYKYYLRKRHPERKAPDHISINTSPTRTSYRSAVVGLNYLESQICRKDNVLIIDTTFRAGRLVNDVVMRLKEVLRRNLDHDRIRVASVYYNPEDRSTWTVRPDITQPHYYLKEVRQEVIYPASVHKLTLRKQLRDYDARLADLLFKE